MFVSVAAETEMSDNQGPKILTKLRSLIIDEGQVALFECQFAVESNIQVSVIESQSEINFWFATLF